MIFFGAKGRQMRLSEGEFSCPQCQVERLYTHMRSTQYFTLYFIPLFRVRNLGEYIECSSCKQQFDMQVLEYEPPTDLELLTQQVRSELEAGLPVHMMEKKLANNGSTPEDAALVLEHATRSLIKTCVDCSFSYISTVTECANCGGTLELK